MLFILELFCYAFGYSFYSICYTFFFFLKKYLHISEIDHISFISVFPLIFNFVLSYSWWTFLFPSSTLLMFFCSIDLSHLEGGFCFCLYFFSYLLEFHLYLNLYMSCFYSFLVFLTNHLSLWKMFHRTVFSCIFLRTYSRYFPHFFPFPNVNYHRLFSLTF